MRTDRYAHMFQSARVDKRGVFVPFLVLGDPDSGACLTLARALIDGGADALELGIPFSDPVADGPTIQAAVGRALGAGTNFARCMEMVGTLRKEYPSVPLGLLAYAGTVFGVGVDEFLRRVSGAGADSVLVADLPVLEAEEYLKQARLAGVGTVFIAPPGLDDRRLASIAEACECFTYVVSRAGVTGADQKLQGGFSDLIARLARAGAPPPMVGFGISTPEHVRAVLDAGAAGAISGSAVVELHGGRPDLEVTASDLKDFASAMRNATFGPAGRERKIQ